MQARKKYKRMTGYDQAFMGVHFKAHQCLSYQVQVPANPQDSLPDATWISKISTLLTAGQARHSVFIASRNVIFTVYGQHTAFVILSLPLRTATPFNIPSGYPRPNLYFRLPIKSDGRRKINAAPKPSQSRSLLNIKK